LHTALKARLRPRPLHFDHLPFGPFETAPPFIEMGDDRPAHAQVQEPLVMGSPILEPPHPYPALRKTRRSGWPVGQTRDDRARRCRGHRRKPPVTAIRRACPWHSGLPRLAHWRSLERQRCHWLTRASAQNQIFLKIGEWQSHTRNARDLTMTASQFGIFPN